MKKLWKLSAVTHPRLIAILDYERAKNFVRDFMYGTSWPSGHFSGGLGFELTQSEITVRGCYFSPGSPVCAVNLICARYAHL